MTLALVLAGCGGSVEGTIAKAKDAGRSPAARCNDMYGLSKEGVAAVAPLVALAADPVPKVAQCAEDALRYVDDREAASELVAVLGNADPGVVASAAEALGSIGDPKTAPAVARLLASPNPDVVAVAVRALDRIGDKSVVPALESLALKRGATPAEDRAGRKARRLAAYALGHLGGPAVKGTLVKVLASDPTSSRAAGTALAQIFQKDVTPLLPLLEDRRNVALAFGLVDVGQSGTEGALVTALKRFGGAELARYYLNCGNSALEDAGRDWAHEHGYNVITMPGTGEGTWGSGP